MGMDGSGRWLANASLILLLLQSYALLCSLMGERGKAVDPSFICREPIHQSRARVSECRMTCESQLRKFDNTVLSGFSLFLFFFLIRNTFD